MESEGSSDTLSTVTPKISGLQCQSCVNRVEAALLRLSGVTDAEVNLAEQKAKISYDAASLSRENLSAAIEAEGYRSLESEAKDAESLPNSSGRKFSWFSTPRPYLYGAIASFAIAGMYLGMNTLTADWYFARVQFKEFRWWITILAFGLGVQVTLFSLLRAQLKKNGMRAAKSSMAASGGVSTAAMAACCSHYPAAILPALGMSFLSAATASLEQYQSYFFPAGVLSCIFGIGLLLRIMKKNGMIPTGNLRGLFRFGGSVNNGGTLNEDVQAA